ncbi:MAG TPA: ArsA family ATPase [Longimicrobiaceae bacterium]|nr:ArsA family ATPase [Longimicrobiaceae bacterium]
MLAELVSPGPRWTFVGGKGGVGKTTVAAALAVALADAGERVLVLSTDPAHSLGDALGVLLGPEPRPVPGVEGLSALEVDAERERARFLEEHRDAVLRTVERGTYLERDEAAGFLDLALPGMDELAAVLRLMELAGESSGLRVVVDTAPTGHTLRLLDLPRLARDWIAALEAMEDRHREVALALAGAYREDEAARDLARLRVRVERLAALLADPAHTRFLLVTTPEPVVHAETRRYLDTLRGRGIAVGGIVVNRVTSLRGGALVPDGVPVVHLPLLPRDPRGVEALRGFGRPPSLDPSPTRGEGGTALRITVGPPWFPPADRRLYLVGGKGGVGKTTVASALAVRLAEEGRAPILLMSTDPAGSLGDVFGTAVSPDPVPVPGAPGVLLRQVDAEAGWEAFRAEYRGEVERLFAELLGRGLSATADREVVGRLVDLAPPGVDEAMALGDVIDLLGGGEYNALVIDTAPTGHLLRLLEMPALALEWSHALLRLFLRYREVLGLGEVAERVLRFARLLRELRARLEDRTHTFFLAVALPEALSVPETERMAARLRELRIPPDALLVNRLLTPRGIAAGREGHAARLLAILPVAAAAPERGEGGPRGAAELLRFAHSWRAAPGRAG